MQNRKRGIDEVEEDSNETAEENPPSPKQVKTYVELKPVTRNRNRTENKATKNDENKPKILNLQAGTTTTEVSKVLKIERRSTLNDGNTEQYVLKEDFYGKYCCC